VGPRHFACVALCIFVPAESSAWDQNAMQSPRSPQSGANHVRETQDRRGLWGRLVCRQAARLLRHLATTSLLAGGDQGHSLRDLLSVCWSRMRRRWPICDEVSAPPVGSGPKALTGQTRLSHSLSLSLSLPVALLCCFASCTCLYSQSVISK